MVLEFLFPYEFVYCNGPTNVRKADEGVLVPCRDPTFRLGEGKGVIDTLKVIGFSDSDYAGCMDDKNSTSSYIFMMTEGAVSWKSIKHILIASFTIEGEYVACYKATYHVIWLRNFI